MALWEGLVLSCEGQNISRGWHLREVGLAGERDDLAFVKHSGKGIWAESFCLVFGRVRCGGLRQGS